jgi:phosphohistidine phosphatase
MELFILRHGRAEAYCANDAGRQLVASGRVDVARVIQRSLPELSGVKQIWASPYVRAQQTAEIAAAALGQASFNEIGRTCDFLTPDADPRYVLDQLTTLPCESLLIVSHQPLVSSLAELACGAAVGRYPMDTAALACIDFDIPGKGLGYLRWLRHPEA